MISFCCQQCSREYKVDDEYGGRKARCKQCNHYNIIPVAKLPAEKAQPEETVSFACDACGQKLRVKRIYVGKRVKCSSCGEPCTIPHPQILASADQASESPATEKAPPAAPAAKKVSFNCLMCSARMQADESQAGEVIECPKCQCYVEVPGKPEETPAEEESYEDWENRPAPEEDYTPIGTSVSSPRPSRKKTSIPAAWKIPAAIGTSIAFTMAAVIVWTVIAVMTGWEWAIIIIAVGGLAGAGLTLYTEQRNTMLGFAAVLIAFCGMATGKAVVVKYAVVPTIQREIGALGTKFSESLDITAKSKNAVRLSSCMEVRDNGELPQELVWPVFDKLMKKEPGNTDSGSDFAYFGLLLVNIKKGIFKERKEDIQKGLEVVTKYIESLANSQKVEIVQAHKQEILEVYSNFIMKNKISFKSVFISSFGIFDLIFIFVGLATAFNLGAGKSGANS